MVQYDLYSADGDDIREKLDLGSIDMGILLEPIETAKYDYIQLPFQEKWGILMRRDDILAQKNSICIEDFISQSADTARVQLDKFYNFASMQMFA